MKSHAFSLFHRPAGVRAALVSLASFASFTASSSAAELYWTDSPGSISGGNGNWNTSTFWVPNSDGTGTAQNWTSGADANFTATDAASSINLEGNTYDVTNLVKGGTQNLVLTTTPAGGALNVGGNINVTGGTGNNLGTVNLTGTSGTQTVRFGNANTTLSGTLVFGTRNWTLNSDATGNIVSTFNMALSGSGNLIFYKPYAAGNNRITIGGNNGVNWTGDFVVNNTGTVQLASSTFFTKDNLVKFDANGILNTRNTFTVGGLSGSTGSINLEGNLGAKTLTIDTSVLGDASFGGPITNASLSTLSLIKTGTGTQTLSGTSTYAGTTSVTGGKLLINGVHTSTTGTSTYSVTGTGSTLGGTGRIAVTGTVTVGSGAILAPGASIGTLTLDGVNNAGAVLSMATDSKFAFTLAGNGGTPDQLDFWNYASGDLALNSNVIDLTLLGAQTGGTYTVDLFRFFSDGGTTSTTHAFNSGLTIGTLGAGIDSAFIDWDGSLNDNKTIALTYTVIPEPGAAVLGGIGILLLLRRRRN